MKKNEKAIKTRRKRKRRHYIYYNEEGRELLRHCRFPGYCPLLIVVNGSSKLDRALDSKAGNVFGSRLRCGAEKRVWAVGLSFIIGGLFVRKKKR
jgi:hypothetical protein